MTTIKITCYFTYSDIENIMTFLGQTTHETQFISMAGRRALKRDRKDKSLSSALRTHSKFIVELRPHE